MKKFFDLTTILFFFLILIVIFLPSRRPETGSWYLLVLATTVYFFKVFFGVWAKDEARVQTVGDVTALIFCLLMGWELATTKFNFLDGLLFPTPAQVLALFIAEIPQLLQGLISSLQLLVAGYTLALFTAVPLAVLMGWRQRLYRAINPLTKVLGPLPPIVYIPYAIALLPSFKTASVFVIFVGAFWPIFINTLNGVFNLDKRLIDTAKTLNAPERAMLWEVILPGTLPSIMSGATLGLVFSFILLTSAEMIGATSGLGWYVKYYADFADYPRVMVGIIFIGLVVTGITYLFAKLEKYLLRWRA